MTKDHFEKLLAAYREAFNRTNVDHEKALYGAWIDALEAELGIEKPATPATSS